VGVLLLIGMMTYFTYFFRRKRKYTNWKNA
jgi:hypothetical protein